MPVNPVDNVGKRSLPAMPYDNNNKAPAVLMAAIVDPTSKEVIGFLPLKALDNGDGTATLYVKVQA